MSRVLVLGGGLAVLTIAVLLFRHREFAGGTEAPFEPPARLPELSPLCPWRDPEADLPQFFPEANRWDTETRILSGLRVELSQQLGRPLLADELALTLHRVYQGARPLGTVLVRRVKGQHGAIEIVLAVTEQGRVCGVRLQRLREPSAVASAIQDRAWLSRFHNRTHEAGWESEDLRYVPAEARFSAAAIREGIRSLLILLAASERSAAPSSPKGSY